MTGRKDDSGKLRMDLLPPFAINEVARVLTYGAELYGDNNWRMVRGKRSRYLAAALRHLFKFLGGERFDYESGISHLAHAAVNCMFLLEIDK